MHAPFVTPPFSPRPAAESEVLEAHPASGSSAVLSPIRYEARCGHCARTIGGDGAAAAAEAIHLHDESHPFCETRGCPMRAAWPTETDDLPRWCDDHGPAQSLRDPRMPGCGVYCAGSVHQLDCKVGRARRDDAWARRSEYEEWVRE